MGCAEFISLWYGGFAPLPMFLVCNTGVCFVTSYLIAYGQNHIFPFWPYISDTGAHPPESCYFGQLLNISAMCAIVFGVLRFWMMKKYMQEQGIHRQFYWTLNTIQLVLMVLAGVGMSMVANFQESNVETLHYIGAAMTFGLGGFYVVVESISSYNLRPVFTSPAVPLVRAFLGVASLAIIGVSVAASMVASNQWGDYGGDQYQWQKGDPGYVWHVVGTGCEWLSGTCFLLFFVTMIPEFRCFAVEVDIRLNDRLININDSEGI